MSRRTFDNWNRYLDNNGKILHGCIQFNVKDGNTIAAIFDVDGTALDNPILTDEYGRTQHQVCIDEDVVAYFYKYVGNGIWSDELDIDTSDVSKWALQYTSENIDQSTLYVTADSLYCVDTIADLRNIDVSTVPEINGHKVITLLGYNTVGDKEPVNYIWYANSLDTDDNGAVIATNDLSGRWKLVQPTEHLDVRHYGVFPSASQNMQDQSDRIRQALTYANNSGIRLFFDKRVNVQTYNYYKISGIFRATEVIDVSSDVKFIDDDVTLTATFNNDVYFVNGDTALISNYAKSSWNIKQLTKASVNDTATYVINDASLSTVIALQDFNVEVNDDISSYAFKSCHITGKGLITDTAFNACTFDVSNTISDGCSFTDCKVIELMFYNTPSISAVSNCIADIHDFVHKAIVWQQFHKNESLDYENVVTSVTRIQPVYPDSDYSVFNFIGTAQFDTSTTEQHTYTFNNCTGNITLNNNADNSTYNFINCNMTVSVTHTSKTQTFNVQNSTITLSDNLSNTIVSATDSVIVVKDLSTLACSNCNVDGLCHCSAFTAFSSIISCEVHASNIVIKDSQINADVYSTEHEVSEEYFVDCFFDNNIFNAQHHVSSSQATAIVRGGWMNNVGNVANPIVLDMQNLNTSDVLHQYVYDNNSGTFLPKYYKNSYVLSGCYTIDSVVQRTYSSQITVPVLVREGAMKSVGAGDTGWGYYCYGVYVPSTWQPTGVEYFSIGNARRRFRITFDVPFRNASIASMSSKNYTFSYTFADTVVTNGMNFVLPDLSDLYISGPNYIPATYDTPKDCSDTTIPPVDASQGYFTITIEIF